MKNVLTSAVLVAVLVLCCATTPAAASSISFGNQFSLHVDDDSLPPYAAQSALPGVLTFGAASAGAGGSADALWASAASTAVGAGGDATARFFDDVAFSVAGGGSATIQVQLGGNWSTAGAGGVGWILHLQNVVYSGSVNPLSGEATPDFNPAGTYSFNGEWQVTDGSLYHIYVALNAFAFAGGSAYIDHPLYFVLPDGVSFTAASGNTYSPAAADATMPEPASLVLLGTSLVAGGLRRRRSSSATGRRGRPVVRGRTLI